MKKFFSNVFTPIKAKVSHARNRTKLMMMGAAIAALTPIGASAQNLAGTGYDAGTSALEEVASELVKYIPYVVNLCYALAGIFAVVGAISVYIAMNNEEQDVKNILVLRNAFEKTRKQMKANALSINALSDNLNFRCLRNSLLKRHKRLFLVSVLFLVSRFIFLSLHQFSEVREEKEKQMSA